MITCPTCGTQNLPQARFCMECGAGLAGVAESTVAAPPAPPVEERRVVTILFVDLIGFTERSDHADPEDVRRTLVPFHGRVKEDIEGFGGTLDKFIGDAVLGVFGAPVAHEDDPVRAVRAGMKILHSIEDLKRTTDPDIAVRVAVNTGEAVVSFGTGPQVGEAVAGDVVNTASRMQGLAPRDSVVIGETTLRAVRDLFEVEELPPAVVKGKTEPITVWRVAGERTQAAPDLAPTRFVGRSRELAVLDDLFQSTVNNSAGGFVVVVGEPGIGKSRLVAEFRRRTGNRARWLTGHCVPYGQAVTFAPVAATVRQVTGIEPHDDPDRAVARLVSLAGDIEGDPIERDWLVSRLQPLLGLGQVDQDDDTIPSGEIARAWARIVGRAAAERPVVVQIDDLHWAEPVLLGLIEELGDTLGDRPVLVLCSARPELMERHEAWGGGATFLRVESLPDEESAALIAELLTQVALAPPMGHSVLARAGGNPLYAVELARMLGEQQGTEVPSDRLALPDSVQALIAARLDAIPSDLRAMVMDASVVGTSFWPGALAELGKRSPADVRMGVEALVHRGLVQRAPQSMFEGESEYGFSHALVGEVAYARIPRAERARRHHSAGRWIDRTSRDRTDERAEMLARHFASAVELAEAAGERDLADAARESAVRFLMSAAERAGRLDAPTAFGLYDRALRIVRGDGPERAESLALSAQMGRRSGRLDGREVLSRFEESLAVYRRQNDPVGIGRALIRVGSQLGALGEFVRSQEALAEAVLALEALLPGPDLARAYAFRAEADMFAGDVRTSMEFARRALDLLPDGGHEEIVIMALHILGDARCSMGDLGGLQDMEEALRLSEAAGRAAEIVTSRSYLGEWLWVVEGPRLGLQEIEAGLALAQRRGVLSQALWTKAGALEILFDRGDWDRSLAWCGELLGLGAQLVDGSLLAVAKAVRARIALLRGRRDDAGDPEEVLSFARSVGEMQVVSPALVVSAELSAFDGNAPQAMEYVQEFARVTEGVAPQYRESRLAPLARVCAMIGDVQPIEWMLAGSEGLVRRDRLNVASARATVAEVKGDPSAAALYAQAAGGWRAFENPFEEGLALLGRARCRTAAGEGEQAGPDRRRAGEVLERLGFRGPEGMV